MRAKANNANTPALFPKVMVTGHRPKSFGAGDAQWSVRELQRTMKRLQMFHGAEEAITGMALGADTWWAESALKLNIPFAAYIPFEAQPDAWVQEDREKWRKLRELAQREVVLGDHYDVRLLHARNDAMLRDADLCVALWRKSATTGGTASTVNKARSMGKPLIILDPEDHSINTENM